MANFDLRTQKSQKVALQSVSFNQSIKYVSQKDTEELSIMTIKSDAKFEEKLTCGLKNGVINLLNFNHSTQSLKTRNFLQRSYVP